MVRFLFIISIFSFILFSTTGFVCPPEGDGGDRILNRLKNRTEIPSSYEEMDVRRFKSALTPNFFTPLFRDNFSSTHRQYVEKNEKRTIALVGYILVVIKSGPDSTNCHSQERRDLHVWIGALPAGSEQEAKAMREEAVVAELTPNGQDLHPAWKLEILQKLAKQGAKIRISGWTMYDPHDRDLLGKNRGTLWELDPVTRFEVWSNGQWKEL